MQTSDYEKTQIIPPHCLWVSELLLISGCRADAGLPRLHRARQPAGNRLATGEKAPGAWGASGASPPLTDISASLASHWAGVTGSGSETAQLSVGKVVLSDPEFLLWGDVSPQAEFTRVEAGSPAAEKESLASSPAAIRDSEEIYRSGVVSAGKSEQAQDGIAAVGKSESSKKKVLFVPKLRPWDGTPSENGKESNGRRPPSFCKKIVTFTPETGRKG